MLFIYNDGSRYILIILYVPGLSSASGMPVFRITSLGISAIRGDNVFFFILYGALVLEAVFIDSKSSLIV
jgi:hypothetical protein